MAERVVKSADGENYLKRKQIFAITIIQSRILFVYLFHNHNSKILLEVVKSYKGRFSFKNLGHSL